MFKRAALLSLVLVVALGGGLFTSTAHPTRAQDDMSKVTCDSTLVTLLFIAENDYGFQSMLDVTSLEKGEYGPLFDHMMAQMDESDMSGGDTMGEADTMSESDESMGEGDMSSDMMVLSPGIVPGEDQLCTDLRAELEGFFYDYFTNEMSTDESMDG